MTDTLTPQQLRDNIVAITSDLEQRFNLSDFQAAGFLGNFSAESGFNPNGPYGDNGTSHGIAQWHAGRLDALNTYDAANKLDPLTLKGQLAYLNAELSGIIPGYDYSGVIANVKKTTDVRGASQVVTAQYESPQDIAGQTPIRQDASQRYLTALPALRQNISSGVMDLLPAAIGKTVTDPKGDVNAVVGVVTKPFTSVADALTSIWHFLTSASTWERIGFVLLGFTFVIIGFLKLTEQASK